MLCYAVQFYEACTIDLFWRFEYQNMIQIHCLPSISCSFTSFPVRSSSFRSRKACPTSTHSSSSSIGSLTTVNFNLVKTNRQTHLHVGLWIEKFHKIETKTYEFTLNWRYKRKKNDDTTCPGWGQCPPTWCRDTAWVELTVNHPHKSLREQERDLRVIK